jgi:hypothetical protein
MGRKTTRSIFKITGRKTTGFHIIAELQQLCGITRENGNQN